MDEMKIMMNTMLPPGTVMVSPDMYDLFKNAFCGKEKASSVIDGVILDERVPCGEIRSGSSNGKLLMENVGE